jgi:hypothetical protein
MGRLGTLGNVVISVHGRDHNPPHFHVRCGDDEALVEIRTLNLIPTTPATTLRNADLRTALEWASLPMNQALLLQEWNRLNP